MFNLHKVIGSRVYAKEKSCFVFVEHCSKVGGEGNSKAGLESEGTSNIETEISFGTLSEVLGSVLPSRQAAETASPRMSWADMSQEDEFEEEDEEEESRKAIDASPMKTPEKPKLSREQREDLRLKNVKRKKDFICLERFKGKLVNVVDGLELHTGVFSAVEQKRIVDKVYELEERGRKGELRGKLLVFQIGITYLIQFESDSCLFLERTFTAPQKWMRGKGRVTIQFGCCYNYATVSNSLSAIFYVSFLTKNLLPSLYV